MTEKEIIEKAKELKQELIKAYGDVRQTAYTFNSAIDINSFLYAHPEFDFFYRVDKSTKHFPVYEPPVFINSNVCVATDANTLFASDEGKHYNLYSIVNSAVPNIEKATKTNTEHFVDVVCQDLAIYGKEICKTELPIPDHLLGKKALEVPKTRRKDYDYDRAEPTKNVFKEYRIDPLQKNEFFPHRGITDETLNAPPFKGTIFSGNTKQADKKYHKKKYNNVIYYFDRLSFENNDVKRARETLLMQLENKIQVGEAMIDKFFAEGGEKSKSLWVSNFSGKDINNICVFENPLDALSYHQTYRPEKTLYIATGGTPSQEQIDMVVKTFETARKLSPKATLRLCNDNDREGHKFDAMFLRAMDERIQIKVVDKDTLNVEIQTTIASQGSLVNAYNRRALPGQISKSENKVSFKIDKKDVDSLAFLNQYVVNTGSLRNVAIDKSVHKDFNDDIASGVKNEKIAEKRIDFTHLSSCKK